MQPPPLNDEFESLRQHVRLSSDSSDAYNDTQTQPLSSPETVDADLTVSGQSPSREPMLPALAAQSDTAPQNSDLPKKGVSASAVLAMEPPHPHISLLQQARLSLPEVTSAVTAEHVNEKEASASPLGTLVNESVTGTVTSATFHVVESAPSAHIGGTGLVTSTPSRPSSSSAPQLAPSRTSSTAASAARKSQCDFGEVEGISPSSSNQLNAGAPQDSGVGAEATRSTGACDVLPSTTVHCNAASERKPNCRPKQTNVGAAAPHRKLPNSPARHTPIHGTTPTKQKLKAVPSSAAHITELLTGKRCSSAKCGTPAETLPPSSTGGGSPSPLQTLDLPLGLLVLYCAAEDVCALTEDVAAPSPPSAHVSAAYSLIYMLERLSDISRRESRRVALQRASATEEAKCKELFEAAAKKRDAAAAQQAAHAQEVEAEELGACTFHPAVSLAAQEITGKGTKDFLAKCLEWKEEATRRLKRKYERQAELAAEEAPVEVVTEHSRRLLESPAVQERLRTRPSLWEAKRPVRDTPTTEAPLGAMANSPLGGAPVGLKIEKEQEAVLRSLREPSVSRQGSSLLNTSDTHHNENRNTGIVRQFLRRVEEDAARREATAARLRSRYHNPEMERYEVGTGQQLFTPNAMPTVWKDGRRVGYEDLTKDEQRDFRAELRKAGLGFLLARHCRDQLDVSHRREGEKTKEEDRDESGGRGQSVGGQSSADGAEGYFRSSVLTTTQQERFMASLQDALTRRERNLAQLRAQATVEETFHPHITARSIKMALHKNGGKPIYERSTVSRDAAAVPPRPPMHNADTEANTPLYVPQRDRSLPEAVEVFLARNEQWSAARQRRLERLAAMEEEKRYGNCTFSPNRTFYEPESSSQMQSGVAKSAEGRAGQVQLSPLELSREGSEQQNRQRFSFMRQQDELATAADVRLMNELELLRSGAAFRDERFVQAVCERTGLSDKRQAMANLSLQSAPRLIHSSRIETSSVQRSGNAPGSARSPSQQISPIARQSNRPSASPYAVPRRLESHPEASIPSAYESLPSVPMMRTESAATQTPLRRDSHDDARNSQRPSMGLNSNHRNNMGDAVVELLPVEDPWAALDAQTDAILKRHGY
jgi:hypothetical protein